MIMAITTKLERKAQSNQLLDEEEDPSDSKKLRNRVNLEGRVRSLLEKVSIVVIVLCLLEYAVQTDSYESCMYESCVRARC